MANSSVFIPILKADRRSDGTMVVTGKATGPDLDIDEQICDPAWLASAMPEWMKWGNIREQHTAIAAGVGLSLEQVGEDWMLESLVVDPGSVKKLENDVLKGYSIGIRNPKVIKDAAAPGGRIVGGKIVEISLVDRPANPSCTLALAKAAKGAGLELVQVPVDQIGKMIVQEGSQWCVRSEDGETSFGCYDTEQEAKERLGEVESFKQQEKAADPEMSMVETEVGELEPGEMEGESAEQEQEETDYIGVARQALADWLVTEAQEVAMHTGTVLVVQMISQLLCDLDWAEEIDEYDDMVIEKALDAVRFTLSGVDPTTVKEEKMDLSTVADLVKAASADDASEQEKEAASVIRKALGLESLSETLDHISKTAADALTKAGEALDPIERFERRLAQVEQMAAPGGPVRTRTELETTKAATAERATELERLAAAVLDPVLKQGYLALAADARKDSLS